MSTTFNARPVAIAAGFLLLLLAIPFRTLAQGGTVDGSYAVGTGANNRVNAIAIQPDGKAVLGGSFMAFNGVAVNRVVRRNRDGSPDAGFNIGSGANSTVSVIALQPDGKILVGGNFSTFNGAAVGKIVRLNADGSTDAGFLMGTGFNARVNSIRVAADGKILVSGAFTSYNGTGRVRVARLNTNGTVDATFNPGTGPNFEVLCSAVRPDGKLIIGGLFNSVNGTARVGIAQLTTTGAVDATFNPGAGADDAIYGMTLQPDGNVMIGGLFTSYNGIARSRIARVLSTGALDLTFKPTTGFNSWVYTIMLQPDGRMVCGGDFTLYNGTARHRITRLHPDGTIDHSFAPGAGFNSWVYALGYQPEGLIVVGGGFTTYQGVARTRIVRLQAGCDDNLSLTLNTDANGAQTSWEILAPGFTYPVCSATGLANNTEVVSNCCLPNGCYRLRVLDSGGDGMTTGGYILRSSNGDRIIDNRFNFSTGSVSAISSNQQFCLPLGTDRLIHGSSDKLDWLAGGQFMVAAQNAAVSAQYGVTNTTSGYEFWIYDPNGTYSFKRFRNHATSDGYGTGAVRACYMKVNTWAVVNHIPSYTLMNIRVRGRVAGVNLPWGLAVRFKIDPITAACPTSQLIDDPANANFSCGVDRIWNNTGSAGRVAARPVSGANRYQFEFTNTADSYAHTVTSTNYLRQLNWGSPALLVGRTYQVRVRISRDAGASYCAWGEACSVTIVASMVQGGGQSMTINDDITSMTDFTVWPNPGTGELINVALDGLPDEEAVLQLTVIDAMGRAVSERTFSAQGPYWTTVVNMDQRLGAGTYVVQAVLGEQRWTSRFIVSE